MIKSDIQVLGPDYTFERQFGRTCPFCGEPWSSKKACGEGPGSWMEQNEDRKLDENP